MDNRARLLIFGIALASTAAPFTKLGFEEFGLSTVVFVRFMLASFFLLPKKGIDFSVWRKNYPTYFAGAASIVLSALALNGMPVAVVVVMFALTPALTMMHRTVTQRRPLSAHDAGAIAVALIGVVILSNFSAQDLQVPVLGMVSLVMALILFTAYGISSATALRNSPSTTTRQHTFYLSISTVVLALPAVILEIAQGTAIGNPGVVHIAVMVHLALFATVGQFQLNQIAIRDYSPLVASLAQYIGIPLSALVALAILAEPITIQIAIGSSLIVAGAFMVRDTELKANARSPRFHFARSRK